MSGRITKILKRYSAVLAVEKVNEHIENTPTMKARLVGPEYRRAVGHTALKLFAMHKKQWKAATSVQRGRFRKFMESKLEEAA